MAKKRIHVLVRGIVQGVGYRYFTIKHAGSLGVDGWVRNTPDGKVEAVAEGEEDALNRLLSAMHEGPWSGKVDSLDVDWDHFRGEFKGFGVRY